LLYIALTITTRNVDAGDNQIIMVQGRGDAGQLCDKYLTRCVGLLTSWSDEFVTVLLLWLVVKCL